jgi:aquaporin Z
MKKSLGKKLFAECLGTAVLVLVACGTAMVTGVNVVATALAFGLVIVAMAYTIGPISGCHINPAVSLAMAINKRITWIEFAAYAVAQTVGAIVGAGILYAIGKLTPGTDYLGKAVDSAIITGNLGSNGYSGLTEKVGPAIVAAIIIEVVLTFIFVLTILKVTAKKDGAGGKAGLIIGLTLTLVHLLGIPLTGTSVNPARSIGPAIFAAFNDTAPIKEVWVFILAPLVGAALAAIVGKLLIETEE